jgi:hypothetical protein
LFPPSFKAFGLEFSSPEINDEKSSIVDLGRGDSFSPSGPITLWLTCLLGFVFALKLLRV